MIRLPLKTGTYLTLTHFYKCFLCGNKLVLRSGKKLLVSSKNLSGAINPSSSFQALETARAAGANANLSRSTKYIFAPQSHDDPIIYTEDIKKSKFVTYIKSASSIDEALQFISKVQDLKATHNCWAYRSYNYERYSDDGEPSGTAGKPILQAIEYENLFNCVVMVTRYFGGVKLGTGGLCRAYGSVARGGLKLVKKVPFIKLSEIRILVTLADIGSLYSVLAQLSSTYLINRSPEQYITICRESHDEKGIEISTFFQDPTLTYVDAVLLILTMQEDIIPIVEKMVQDACRGRAVIQPSYERV